MLPDTGARLFAEMSLKGRQVGHSSVRQKKHKLWKHKAELLVWHHTVHCTKPCRTLPTGPATPQSVLKRRCAAALFAQMPSQSTQMEGAPKHFDPNCLIRLVCWDCGLLWRRQVFCCSQKTPSKCRNVSMTVLSSLAMLAMVPFALNKIHRVTKIAGKYVSCS
jgi:hypothetical protein